MADSTETTANHSNGALAAPWRIGVDIGGTFTDLVLQDAAGRMVIGKVRCRPT